MDRRYPLERLGGADPDVLAYAGTGAGRGQFVAMAGVLLTTASVATISMFFALHSAVSVPVGWAVPLGLAWGVVIINIDRYLVVTMNGTRGRPFHILGMVLVRLLLAAVIATVVSMPLVLRIFASDINAELPILATQKSAEFKNGVTNSADGKLLADLDSKIKAERAVVDGTGSSLVGQDQARVQDQTTQLQSARGKEQAAYSKWQCEIGGLTGAICQGQTTGVVGNGTHAKIDENAYNQDKATADGLQAQLTQSQNTLKTDQQAAQQDAASAQQTLTGLEAQRGVVQARVDAAIAGDDQANHSDTGLLAQIHALFAASAKNPGLATAHWTVTALFFMIELLPVAVKSMLLFGRESSYEAIAVKVGEIATLKAQEELDAELDALRSKTKAVRDIAAAEAEANLAIRRRKLQVERAVVNGKARVEEKVEADMRRREEESRIEVNEKVARQSRKYVKAMLRVWSQNVHDTVTLAMHKHNMNGHAPPSQQQNQGYTTPNSGGGVL